VNGDQTVEENRRENSDRTFSISGLSKGLSYGFCNTVNPSD
jgi:hypothetical protein